MNEPAKLATSTSPSTKQFWKGRFFSIWGGQALSLVGSALTQFVLIWWITQTTGSASALAVAGMMALLPQALLGPIGGTIADRFDRRLIMIAADSVTALCMLILVLLFSSGSVQLWHVYTLMFIRSSMQAFQAPAAMASTSMLVPEDWLSRAAGLNQTLQGVMTIASAPLGALLLAVLPLEGALLIDVFTAVIGITPLLIYRIPQIRSNVQGISLFRDFADGLKLVTKNRGLAHLYGVLGLVVLMVMPTFTLTPLLVTNHFGGGVNEVALMEGCSGVGMIVGGALTSIFAPKRRMAMFLLAFSVCCGALAATAFMPVTLFGLAVVWWTVSGISFAVGNAPFMAILQTAIPNEMQGRAFSLMSTIMGLAGPVGLAIAGPLGELVGVRGVFIIGGGLAALVCLLGFGSRSLMQLETQKINV